MRKSYTPNELRTLAKQTGPQWSGEAHAALSFAADVIDAANAALAQPVSAKPLPQWIPVSERFPGHPPVLAGFFDKYSGKFKAIKAAWVAKHTEEIGASDFQGDEDYDAETDTSYWPEGWYEWNEFEETHWLVGQPITHWMPLPEAPSDITKEHP